MLTNDLHARQGTSTLVLDLGRVGEMQRSFGEEEMRAMQEDVCRGER